MSALTSIVILTMSGFIAEKQFIDYSYEEINEIMSENSISEVYTSFANETANFGMKSNHILYTDGSSSRTQQNIAAHVLIRTQELHDNVPLTPQRKLYDATSPLAKQISHRRYVHSSSIYLINLALNTCRRQ